MQLVLQLEQPVPLGLGELGDGDAGRARDDVGDVGERDLGDLAAVDPGGGPGELRADLGDPVAQLARPLVLLVGDGLVLVALQLFEALLQPAPVGGRGARAQPHPGPGLVHEVDGLVGQEALGDVAVGQLHRGPQRLLGVAHLVVGLVPVAQPVQDLDRVGAARLGHHDRLEAAGERRVGLDVAAVLVQRRRADDVQLAAGQRRLEHVPGVHGAAPAVAAPAARADHRVQLVDEDDQLVAVRADLVDQRPQPLLEVAAVAGARDDAGELQLHHAAPDEGVRDVAVGDALGDALDHRRLADAGLADEHRVVLGAAREHLDGLLDLVGPAHDGVELPGPGRGGEVLAELVERRGLRRPVGRGGGPRGRPLRRAPGCGPGPGEQAPGRRLRVGRDGQQHVVGADVGRPERAGHLVPVEQRPLRGGGEAGGPAGRLGAAQSLLERPGEGLRIHPGTLQPLPGRLQPGRGEQQVQRVEVGVTAVHRHLRGDAEQLARPRAEEPREVHPPRGATGAGGAEEARQQFVGVGILRTEEAGHGRAPLVVGGSGPRRSRWGRAETRRTRGR